MFVLLFVAETSGEDVLQKPCGDSFAVFQSHLSGMRNKSEENLISRQILFGSYFFIKGLL